MSEYIVDLTDVEKRKFSWSMETLYEQVPVREEIVRCRDCQWFTQIASGGVCVRNGYFSISTADDGFCSKADRRDA